MVSKQRDDEDWEVFSNIMEGVASSYAHRLIACEMFITYQMRRAGLQLSHYRSSDVTAAARSLNNSWFFKDRFTRPHQPIPAEQIPRK